MSVSFSADRLSVASSGSLTEPGPVAAETDAGAAESLKQLLLPVRDPAAAEADSDRADETAQASDEPQGDPQTLLDLLLTAPDWPAQSEPLSGFAQPVAAQPDPRDELAQPASVQVDPYSGLARPASLRTGLDSEIAQPGSLRPGELAQPVPHAGSVTLTATQSDSGVAPSSLMLSARQPIALRSATLSQPSGVAPIPTIANMPAGTEEAIAAIPQASPLSPLISAALNRDASAAPASVLALPDGEQERAGVLQKALGERLEMQISQRSQKATIRLDPPHLGKLEISLHYESGKLQVQIQAAQPEIYRALQQSSHELRSLLSEQHSVQVNVQVSSQGGDSRQQQRQPGQPEEPVARNYEEVAQPASRADGTILTMV